jgi:hypothetical protein
MTSSKKLLVASLLTGSVIGGFFLGLQSCATPPQDAKAALAETLRQFDMACDVRAHYRDAGTD